MSEHYDVAALRRDHSLVNVIMASGIALSPAGPRRLKGLCPFHDDRTPSLVVYEDDQHFHCFACGAHGDVIDFVQRRFEKSFGEACAWITGLPRGSSKTETQPPKQPHERRWDRLTLDEQVVMNTAAALYHHRLWREPRALAYLRERGIPDWVIRACALGYADGHSLETFLRRRADLQTAQDLGLLRRPSHGDSGPALREFLANRIVIPELRGGQCIWFIGRCLDDAPGRPKYLSLSGERPVLGFTRAAGQREVFLCEGAFDFLTAVSWNLAAFSPCGTRLSSDRLGFLARARVVYGVLDADDAGDEAALRFSDQLGLRWQPLSLPRGCDLNDLARQPYGRAMFFRLLAEARQARRKEGAHEHASLA